MPDKPEKLNPAEKIFWRIFILFILIIVATLTVCFYMHHSYINEITKIEKQNNITEQMKNERQDNLRNKISFWDSIGTGVILGGIFIIIALYYFYNNILELLQTGDRTTVLRYGGQSINVLMARWFIPPLILQCCVIILMFITVYEFPFKDSIYIQPYRYGKLYKQLENAAGDLALESENVTSDKVKVYLQSKKELVTDHFKAISKFDTDEITSEYIIYRVPFFIALSFSFLGVLIFSLKDAAFRLHANDLYPRTFVSYLVRFLFATTLSISIAYFLMNNWPVNSAPILFFLIGFFPQKALQYVEDKALKTFTLEKPDVTQVPLGKIQGMSEYKTYRFKEIGITDAQNLASADLNFLKQNLSFCCSMLCDFISQSILLIHLQDDIEKLRKIGIRDILSFKAMVKNSGIDNVAAAAKIDKEILDGMLKVMESEPMKTKVDSIAGYIKESTKEEISKMTPHLSVHP
jgi:hypothetical protein